MGKKAAAIAASGEPALSLSELDSDDALAGIAGPGTWLVAQFHPATLFSLKMSSATSGVGKTLLVPTPYVVKMAMLDAALRTGGEPDAERTVERLRALDLRVGVPERAIVTHTIVKIRQEPKKRTEDSGPYIAAVAYREFVHMAGDLAIAMNLAALSREGAQEIISLIPMVKCFGKRGSLFQFLSMERRPTLDASFTQSLSEPDLPLSSMSHIAYLDDFGPEASFEILNSFESTTAKRDKHRKFVRSIVPLGLLNCGPGFSEYSKGAGEKL